MGEIQFDPAPQGDGQANPDGSQLPAQDNFNPQDFGFQFRHETVYPKDRNEITELMQLGRSYRENKATWEAERNQYAQIKPKYQQYEQFEQALQKNPQFAQELQTLAQRYSQQAQQPKGDERYSELATQVERMQQFQEDYTLNQELSSLESKYNSYDWKKDSGEGNLRRQLLIFMRDNGVTNPDMAFRAMMFEQAKKQAEFQGANKASLATQAGNRAGIVVGAGAKPPAAPVKRANGYGQALDFSLQEMGIT
jgi:hypothetical protein